MVSAPNCPIYWLGGGEWEPIGPPDVDSGCGPCVVCAGAFVQPHQPRIMQLCQQEPLREIDPSQPAFPPQFWDISFPTREPIGCSWDPQYLPRGAVLASPAGPVPLCTCTQCSVLWPVDVALGCCLEPPLPPQATQDTFLVPKEDVGGGGDSGDIGPGDHRNGVPWGRAISLGFPRSERQSWGSRCRAA